MDSEKLQSLINMSIKYLDNRLDVHEKKSAEEVSRNLFYQTLHGDDPPDSELNRKIRLFAVMAQNFSNNKPMSSQDIEDLKGMVAYMRSSIRPHIQTRVQRVCSS